jgi:hypothetical protein
VYVIFQKCINYFYGKKRKQVVFFCCCFLVVFLSEGILTGRWLRYLWFSRPKRPLVADLSAVLEVVEPYPFLLFPGPGGRTATLAAPKAARPLQADE